MTDTDILRKALERYRNATANNTAFKDDVIVFLEKEIDKYRERLELMENNVESMAKKNHRIKLRLNAIYGVQNTGASLAEAVQELSEKHDALAGRVDQLGDIIENKMDQFLGDTVQTLTTFTEDRTSDGGTMTLATHTKYEEVQEILLRNGYFVTSHFDDENSEDETITIEFWRA